MAENRANVKICSYLRWLRIFLNFKSKPYCGRKSRQPENMLCKCNFGLTSRSLAIRIYAWESGISSLPHGHAVLRQSYSPCEGGRGVKHAIFVDERTDTSFLVYWMMMMMMMMMMIFTLSSYSFTHLLLNLTVKWFIFFIYAFIKSSSSSSSSSSSQISLWSDASYSTQIFSIF